MGYFVLLYHYFQYLTYAYVQYLTNFGGELDLIAIWEPFFPILAIIIISFIIIVGY